MTTQTNMLVASQRVALETAQDIGLQMLDATAKLCELNVQTGRTLLAEATQKLTSKLEANGGQITDNQAAAALEPSSQKAAAYARHVYEIATQASAGIVAAVQKHALMAAPQLAMQNMGSPMGTEALVAAMTNPFGAAQKAFQQAMQTVPAPIASAPASNAAAA